ncbi:MAG: phage holin family protein [Myxococcota bacterium]|nr:phage holin family protein [Myxococcota bacterium]
MAEVIKRGSRSAWEIPDVKVPSRSLQDAPAGELLSGMMEQGRRLMREEVRLAKAELREETREVGRDAAAIGGGGVLAHTGALVLAGAVVAVLSLLMPVWAAALITAVALLGIGGAIALSGYKKLKKVHGPRETVATLKEDQQWAKQTAHDAKLKLRARN